MSQTPITWRDIRAPDYRAANSLIVQSANTFQNAFNPIQDLLKQRNEGLAKQELDQQQARANTVFGQITGGTDPNQVNPDYTGLGAQGSNVFNAILQARKANVDNLNTVASTQGTQAATLGQNASTIAQQNVNRVFGLNDTANRSKVTAETNAFNAKAGYLDTIGRSSADSNTRQNIKFNALEPFLSDNANSDAQQREAQAQVAIGLANNQERLLDDQHNGAVSRDLLRADQGASAVTNANVNVQRLEYEILHPRGTRSGVGGGNSNSSGITSGLISNKITSDYLTSVGKKSVSDLSNKQLQDLRVSVGNAISAGGGKSSDVNALTKILNSPEIPQKAKFKIPSDALLNYAQQTGGATESQSAPFNSAVALAKNGYGFSKDGKLLKITEAQANAVVAQATVDVNSYGDYIFLNEPGDAFSDGNADKINGSSVISNIIGGGKPVGTKATSAILQKLGIQLPDAIK